MHLFLINFQDLKVQVLDNGTSMAHFGSLSVSRLWENESQDSFEGIVSRPHIYEYDTTEEDVELTSIGSEVMVDKKKLELLLATTADSPTRFVRGLLMLVFSKEELKGRSVTGRRRHSSCITQQKDPLECGRLNAVVDFTLGVFPDTSVVRIRQTISNKLKEVNNASMASVGTSCDLGVSGLLHN